LREQEGGLAGAILIGNGAALSDLEGLGRIGQINGCLPPQ
jgi:hypothetical protein